MADWKQQYIGDSFDYGRIIMEKKTHLILLECTDAQLKHVLTHCKMIRIKAVELELPPTKEKV